MQTTAGYYRRDEGLDEPGEIGDSYIDFITKVRIDKAKGFLKQTDMRISDIELSVGYPNPQYFSTLFKKYTGIPPAEYRLL